MSRWRKLAIGLAAALALAWLYHGPLGTGERLVNRAESRVRAELVRLEMGQVAARMGREPLDRSVWLTGRADDFQRGELVRILGEIPGVGRVRWAAPQESGGGLPLLAEVELLALVAFGVGLALAWLITRRRPSQW